MMLTGTVTMYDVQDVEAFVRGTIRRKVQVIPPDDMEDMVAEGLLIMCQLNAKYDPTLDSRKHSDPTHECRGSRCCVPSFAGYATFILPKKLKEAWFAKQPQFQSRNVDGKRTYVMYATAFSVEERDGQQHGHDLVDTQSVVDNARQPGNFIPVPIVPKGAEAS